MKIKLTDLNEHLFEQLERLNDEDLKGDALTEEIERSKAITSVAREIVSNAQLILDAHKLLMDPELVGKTLPTLLTDKK